MRTTRFIFVLTFMKRFVVVLALIIGIFFIDRWYRPDYLKFFTENSAVIQAIDSAIDIFLILAKIGLATITYLSLRDILSRNKNDPGETLDQRNRRVMLNHVENFWIKGDLEKSLYGVALLELGIKENPKAVNCPWTIKTEATDEVLPTGKPMLDIFEEIGMGRSLLILGAPGAGKTTMLLELTRQLIECARNDITEPIPVVFKLGSWNGQKLAVWLAEQLNILYFVPKKTAPVWVNENKMLLLLDGLDEVKKDSRAKCVEAINQFRTEHGLTSVVVSSRIEDYSTIGNKLTFDGAITIQPLTLDQINAYIDRFGNSLASVRLLIKKDQALQELAETPLTLSVMTLAYKDRKADELVADDNIKEQRSRLFDAYISRMFERAAGPANADFPKEETLHYLNWLASQMIEHNIINFQIESIQPAWIKHQSQSRTYRLYCNLLASLFASLFIGGLFGLWLGWLGGLLLGLGIGLLCWLTLGPLLEQQPIVYVDKLRWSWEKFRSNYKFVLLIGLGLGLPFGLITGLGSGLPMGLYIYLVVGLFNGLLFGRLLGHIQEIEETSYPQQHLKNSFYNGFIVMNYCLLVIFLFAQFFDFGLVLMGAFSEELIGPVRGVLEGLLFGLFVGLPSGYGAFVLHYTLRFVLAQYKLIPWNLMKFLEHTAGLIFLHRVGGSYIFVHRLLMEHFAEMELPPQPDRAGR